VSVTVTGMPLANSRVSGDVAELSLSWQRRTRACLTCSIEQSLERIPNSDEWDCSGVMLGAFSCYFRVLDWAMN